MKNSTIAKLVDNIYDDSVNAKRLYLYKRDQGKCYICSRKLDINKMTLDHVVPQCQGGSNLRENLKCCCRTCNNQKSKIESYINELELFLDGKISKEIYSTKGIQDAYSYFYKIIRKRFEEQTKKKLSWEEVKVHSTYLLHLWNRPDLVISKKTAALSWIAYVKVSLATNCAIKVPAACTGPDGQMFYSWDINEHHLELEIFSDKPAEWFYKNHESDDTWQLDWLVADLLPSKSLEYFKFFIPM